MEGYYQYSIDIDEGDATRTYNGVVYTDDGYDSTASRIASWYNNYGTIKSITISRLSNCAVCELPTAADENKVMTDAESK